jgi:hypothetical protein
MTKEELLAKSVEELRELAPVEIEMLNNCTNCDNCNQCFDCIDCKDCNFCNNCIGIKNGEWLRYVAYGIKLSKEEYERKFGK